jgi:hypothetical protein
VVRDSLGEPLAISFLFGRVQDERGAGLPHATIELRKANSIVKSTTSDYAGRFCFDNSGGIKFTSVRVTDQNGLDTLIDANKDEMLVLLTVATNPVESFIVGQVIIDEPAQSGLKRTARRRKRNR